MEIIFVGLGKMGMRIAGQIQQSGYTVHGYDNDRSLVDQFVANGGTGVDSVVDTLDNISDGQRVIWFMIPAGNALDNVLVELKAHLRSGDIIIDGGNSFYKDSIKRAEDLLPMEVSYLDVGTSGGLTGAEAGACLMVGGNREAFDQLEPIFKNISVEGGYLYCGKSGTGHFVKMIHNGIEYGMMQAIGEGFEIMEKSDMGLDLGKIANVWTNGSVIRGWLMELTESALTKESDLASIQSSIKHSGEGKWTAQTALDLEVSAPIITQSLQVRFSSQNRDNFSGKLVAALRNEFGGHGVEKAKD